MVDLIKQLYQTVMESSSQIPTINAGYEFKIHHRPHHARCRFSVALWSPFIQTVCQIWNTSLLPTSILVYSLSKCHKTKRFSPQGCPNSFGRGGPSLESASSFGFPPGRLVIYAKPRYFDAWIYDSKGGQRSGRSVPWCCCFCLCSSLSWSFTWRQSTPTPTSNIDRTLCVLWRRRRMVWSGSGPEGR